MSEGEEKYRMSLVAILTAEILLFEVGKSKYT